MNKLKKAVVLLLVAAVMVVMAGCSDNKKLVGTWNGTVDCKESFMSSLSTAVADDNGLLDYFELDKFDVTLIVTFSDDDTFKLEVDKDKYAESMDGVKQSLGAAMRAYFEDELTKSAEEEGLTLEQLMAYCGVSDVDGLIEVALGMSADDVIDSAFDSLDFDAMLTGAESSGTYEAKNGNISLTVGNTTTTEQYKLDGDTLTLIEPNASSDGTLGLSSFSEVVLSRAAE